MAEILLKHTVTPGIDLAFLEKLREDLFKGDEIRCPRCLWQPDRDCLWTCVRTGHPEYFSAGCGTSWHTFDTHGVCPGCSHAWQWTACFRCNQWSPHEEWYETKIHGRSEDRPLHGAAGL